MKLFRINVHIQYIFTGEGYISKHMNVNENTHAHDDHTQSGNTHMECNENGEDFDVPDNDIGM